MKRFSSKLKKNKEQDQGFMDVFMIILKGCALGIIISFILFVVLAVIMNIAGLKENIISASNQFIKLFSIVIAASYTARKSKNRGWLKGASTGVLYILLALLIMSLFDAPIAFDKIFLSNIIMGLIAGAVGGMIGINIK